MKKLFTFALMLCLSLVFSIAVYANETSTVVDERVVGSGVTECGVPFTVYEIETKIETTDSLARLVISFEITRQMVFQTTNTAFSPPATQWWSEWISGSHMTGTLHLTRYISSPGINRIITATYTGFVFGRP